MGVLGQIGLIASATGWMGLVIPPLALAYWAIQSVYLRTSRQLRFLEIEAKGPLWQRGTLYILCIWFADLCLLVTILYRPLAV